MNEDLTGGPADQWFDSRFMALNESYQIDLRRLVSPDTFELIHSLSDFYLYDPTALLVHLLGLTSHYLTSTSFVYADNQLKHRLNLHLLLIVRSGYNRSSLIEHIRQSMNNVHCLRQTGQSFDSRHPFHSNIFCRTDDSSTLSSGLCLSDQFDDHVNSSHLQRQYSSSIIGTSNGQIIRKFLEMKFHRPHDYLTNSINNSWLMIFLSSKARLFCRRTKHFDPHRYPSLEQWILAISGHCSHSLDFYFDENQANQLMCDYLDGLSLKAISLEDTHPWMSARYISAREHVLRLSALLRLIELTIETLVVYRRTFHSFSQADKVFFDNFNHLIEQARGTTTTNAVLNPTRVTISMPIVQSAIYFVNTSLKQFEIMFEPSLSSGTNHSEFSSMIQSTSTPDRLWMMHSASSSFPPQATTSPSSSTVSATTGSAPKRLKPFIDPSYVKSLELAHELLLLPFVAFTRTSVYANSKLKRNAVYLDSVIEELKRHRLLIMVRQGVQMVDGTRRRVDLLVKHPPMFKDDDLNHEKTDEELFERLSRFGVDYDRYVQTLGTLDIGDKYRLSDQCYDLLNSPDYKRYLTVDLERIAPLHRLQQNHSQSRLAIPSEDLHEIWTSSSSTSTVKHEPDEFYQ